MILDEIASYAKQRIIKDKEQISYEEMKEMALSLPKGDFVFERTLKANYPALICEVKKASPSKGIISEDFPYLEIAKDYESSQATCMSVLTEPKWFLGSDQIFQEIREVVSLPMLRKDFTIDDYQIYQAKVLGADCVLLIVALLSPSQITSYIEICDYLGISALIETHDEDEIRIALDAGARILGVNNRNLKDFTVHLDNANALRKYIPEDIIYVAESGISTPSDGINLVRCGANALLIGEALMRTSEKKSFIQEIRGAQYD